MARRLKQLAELPVTELRGVGDARAKSLAKIDVLTVLDLLTYYPRRYLDRTKEARIGELAPGEEAMVLVRVTGVRSQVTRSRKKMVVVTVSDGSGSLKLTFFNQAFRERQLTPGTEDHPVRQVEVFGGQHQ
jgi:ATP-dependent DNA helicase RecG